MITLIQDALTVWRDAEQLLERTPPSSPDHETVSRLVLELRATYQRLTAARDLSAMEIDTSRDSIDRARDLLSRIRTPSPPDASSATA